MGSRVNYKPLFCDKIQEFIDKCPDHTLGEFVYSLMRQLSKSGTPIDSKSDALRLTDKQLYSSICKVVKEESIKEDPIILNTNK